MSAISGTRIIQQQRPVDLIEIAQRTQSQNQTEQTEKTSFKDMFSRELAQSRGIEFSKHAHDRMYSRGLELSDDQLDKLAGALDRAGDKGSKETLVLSEDAAFVVSVPNRTVITVFDKNNLRDGVVTSIDSAVII
ncbi:MAG TPA: TIGR02530 family flagellar biosynthesis protein [candidate division Zixibacteria bacterium]|nr:TIGR02530 family flagellar biosynthesis protein [candidate division Zixibacteria bacterium]